MPIRQVMLIVVALMMSSDVADAEPAASSAERVQVVDVMAAWQKRADGTKSARFKFSNQAGDFVRFSRFQSEWVMPDGDDEKSVDDYVLELDGDRVCCRSLQWTYDEHVQRRTLYFFGELPFPRELAAGVTARRFDEALYSGFRDKELELRDPQRFKAICDGQARYNIWQASDSQYPRAIKLRPPSPGAMDWIYFSANFQGSFDLDGLLSQPLVLLYRPFHPSFAGIVAENCVVLDQPSVIGGHSCLVLRESVPSDLPQDLSRTYWVDPARDCCVLRYIGTGKELPTVQFDIQYEHDDADGWVPSSWTVMRIPADERDPVQEFATMKVTEHSFNGPVDEKSFDTTFPAGTWVLDMDKQVSYIVKEDGTKRPVLDLEYRAGAEYADLAASVPGQGYDQYLARRSRGKSVMWLAGLAVLGTSAVVVAGDMLYRARSRRAQAIRAEKRATTEGAT